MSHSWQEILGEGWRCASCGKFSGERVPDYRGCMSPGLLQKEPKGDPHIWLLVRKNGKNCWECCDCGVRSYEDLPEPTHGCKGGKHEPDNRS